jgi:hypothetical protein
MNKKVMINFSDASNNRNHTNTITTIESMPNNNKSQANTTQ